MVNMTDSEGEPDQQVLHSPSGSVVRTPLYFRTEEEPLFGWYHAPAKVDVSTTGMVICPPIGYEYMSGHRAMRHLADGFASEGIPTMRFDYHGTGDSAGIDEDPDRVTSWLESIREAVKKLKDVSGCTHVGLIGVRIGATLAALIAEEVALSCLILWAPCINGRHYVREMKFLQQNDDSCTSDDIESAGFVLSAQTVKDLSSIKLTKRVPKATKILIVARDDLQDDFTLLECWKEQGLSVSYLRMNGFSDFLTSPHKTKIPQLTIAEIIAWIKNNVDTSIVKSTDCSAVFTISVTVPGRSYLFNQEKTQAGAIRERIVMFGPENTLFGILSEPTDSSAARDRPTVLLLNSGAVHHAGTNRFYVLLARHLAQQGISVFRMDIGGLGDSVTDDLGQENILYHSGFTQSVDDAMTHLRERDGRRTFIVAGLCFGSYASFHSALELSSPSIVECIIINPLVFYWREGMSLDEPGLAQDLSTFKSYQRSMWKRDRWIKLIRGGVNLRELTNVYRKSLFSALWSRMKHLLPESTTLSADLKKMVESGTHLSFVIADRDPGYELLMLDAKKSVRNLSHQGKLSIDIIESSTHTFPLRRSRHSAIEKISDNLIQRYPI